MEKGLWVIFFFTLILIDRGRGDLDKTSKINEKGNLNVTRDESSEEPKSMNYSGNASLDNVTDSKTLLLEDSHIEGCDPSDSCINEKDMFVACLRVPGEDSLDLSHLIRNKGTKALDVKIVAPDFVHPEDTSVSLKPKLDREVKVFLKDGDKRCNITLLAKDGDCSLSLWNTISTSIKNETSRLPNYLNFFSISIFLAAVIFAGAAWLSIRFWRNRASRYQKVNMVLPLSIAGTAEADESDGWDDEAAKTPSKPVPTPSFKGTLASRKLNKDGWND
ncbi:uncharacterized protein LOC141843382 [Curcuma longa]|uniref:uncharacterized protein LOC141843382 n=1 Tax=Curcuma longa TaxID=136217 RepID=UPI003D9E2445